MVTPIFEGVFALRRAPQSGRVAALTARDWVLNLMRQIMVVMLVITFLAPPAESMGSHIIAGTGSEVARVATYIATDIITHGLQHVHSLRKMLQGARYNTSCTISTPPKTKTNPSQIQATTKPNPNQAKTKQKPSQAKTKTKPSQNQAKTKPSENQDHTKPKQRQNQTKTKPRQNQLKPMMTPH